MKRFPIMLVALIVAAAWIAAPLASQSLSSLIQPQPGKAQRATSGNMLNNDDAIDLAMGETKTLGVLDGPGKITHFWLIGWSQDIRFPRALVLRIYWDGAAVPSVEVPFGDFFAAGNGMRAEVDSLPIQSTSYGRALNSYWRMPFARSARTPSTPLRVTLLGVSLAASAAPFEPKTSTRWS